MSLHPDWRAALAALVLDGDSARIGTRERRASPSEPLPAAARELLYEAFYLRPRARPRPVSQARRSAFAQSLVAANRSPHGFEAGWTEDGVWRGLRVLRRDGLRVYAPPARVHPGGLLQVPPVQRDMLPGYLIALGSTPPRPEAAGLRLYWNLRPELAAAWMAAVTGALEAAGLPFRLKLPDDPAAYWRADAGVIYLDARDEAPALAALKAPYSRLGGRLARATPRFTLPLGPGLARADDPPGPDSFGEGRCRLAAEACLNRPRLRDREAALLAQLQALGMDPMQPWKQP